jgi:hypothetical protein
MTKASLRVILIIDTVVPGFPYISDFGVTSASEDRRKGRAGNHDAAPTPAEALSRLMN